MAQSTFIINEPLDMHLHLRDADMLKLVGPLTSKTFSGALIMPNLVPPITTKEALLAYKDRIKEACKDDKFEPFVTLFFKNDYSYEFLSDVKNDIIGIKLYPAGITTNSETGVASMDIEVLRPTLESMSKLGIPLCIHGETNGFVMDREKEFMPIFLRKFTYYASVPVFCFNHCKYFLKIFYFVWFFIRNPLIFGNSSQHKS